MIVTDDIDIACFSLRWDGDEPIINAVSSDELEALPEFVTDSINVGTVAVLDGLMYGLSEEHLIGEPLWRSRKLAKKKRGFMDGYETYDTSQGHGKPSEWKGSFRERMGLDEANTILGDDDPLVILGLTEIPNAHLLRAFTVRKIKKAYLRMAHKWHPDRNKGNETKAEAMFKKIQAAYVKLGGS